MNHSDSQLISNELSEMLIWKNKRQHRPPYPPPHPRHTHTHTHTRRQILCAVVDIDLVVCVCVGCVRVSLRLNEE